MPIKDINYFDHEADIGIIGFSETVEKAFINAAEALFAIMVEDLSRVKQEASVAIEFEESDLELALVTWLNLLVAQARSHNLMFGDFELKRHGDQWIGKGKGETWTDKIVRGTEVKGATLTMLSVNQEKGQWQASCVVDV
ncbi:archease [Coxiella burnetii]|uniref:archease n=1 Tax=Coxiella burnetii TaxID=777 RepID=UPI0000ED01E8|nr:archease [Coxiella burnetii]ACJ20243.1 hypothetical cytosolic protein [Coxiella burnetii CbuK_Q154]AIT63306.1 putative cytosolic protein [Coxiella burnetii str. Namibia]ATN85893.1 archease [Coxiella burnetii str. Schperling]EAX32122.1 archease [Coxiella burnetii 'MSU Goat Q177']EDR35190.1 conserved hypothetical protein [Coxiella burnetii Q321]